MMQVRDRVKELRRVPAADLRKNPRNWRKHGEAQTAALRAMLAEIGFAGALLARELPDGSLELIDGHLRTDLTADATVPVLVLDLTEAESRKLLLTFDPIAAMAEADTDALKSLMDEWKTDNPALQALFDHTAKEYDVLIGGGAPLEEPPAQIDKAAELQKKWGTALGQVWEAHEQRLFCGDCRNPPQELFAGRKIRLVWTDPPYGVSYGAKNEFLNAVAKGNRIQTPINNDQLKPDDVRRLFVQALQAAGARAELGMVCYVTVPAGPLLLEFLNGLGEAGISYRHQLVWVKQQFVIGRSDYHYRHESILYGWVENGPHYWNGDRSQDSVFEIDKLHVSDLHPTTKPVELVAAMIRNSSKAGDVVYDPFLGSGTTLIAAHQLGRVGLGCEIDPGYVAVALERLSLLGLTPKPINGPTA